jgi:serine/threonine protein phosphatase PrpC
MGDFLSTPNKTKDSMDGENNFVRFGASAMQGWRYRMEDAHLHSLNNSNLDIFGVFDGHGGKEVSLFVKNHFIEEFNKNENTKLENIPNSLIETFLKMDQLLRTEKGKKELVELNKLSKKEDAEQDRKEKKNATNDIYKTFDPKNSDDCDIANITGCTACVSVINNKEKKIYFANAGDSRAVICKNGVGYQMSHDHKPDWAKEKNRIYKSGGWVSEGRIKGNLNLSRSLGDFEYKQDKNLDPKDQMITAYPEINIEILDNSCEFIILACDGIWDCLTPQEACNFVRERLYDTKTGLPKNDIKISKIIEEMMDHIIAEDIANENGIGCDNMTCIVIQFKQNNKAINLNKESI